MGRVHLQQTEEPSPRGFTVCVYERGKETVRATNDHIQRDQTVSVLFCVCSVDCYFCPSIKLCLDGCGKNSRVHRLQDAAWLCVRPTASPTQHIAVQRAAVKDTE